MLSLLFSWIGYLSVSGVLICAVAGSIYFRSRMILYAAVAVWIAFNVFGAGFQQGNQECRAAVEKDLARMSAAQTTVSETWDKIIAQRHLDEAAANIQREKNDEAATSDPNANSCGLSADSVRRLNTAP